MQSINHLHWYLKAFSLRIVEAHDCLCNGLHIVGNYVLSIRDYDQTKGDCVKHYQMHNLDDGGVYIAARRTFSNIIELVDHYKGWSGMICCSLFHSLPDDKIFNLSKFKAFAEDKLKVAEMEEFVLDRVENIVGKRENAGYQHFLLFLQCFQKASL